MDPLTAGYPWYTPYQFAGNKPIWKVDLDGLEEADPEESTSDYELVTTDGTASQMTPSAPLWESLEDKKAKTVEDGYGQSEWNVFILEAITTQEDFDVLKKVYSTDPGQAQNNPFAYYYPIEDPFDNNDVLNVGEGMAIDIFGPYNGIVRFTDVQVTESSFSVSAEIVEGGDWAPVSLIVEGLTNFNHPDAGKITFSGTFDANSNTMVFQIANHTTLGNWATYLATPLARGFQSEQWRIVVNNVQQLVNATEVISKIHIQTKDSERTVTDFGDRNCNCNKK